MNFPGYERYFFQHRLMRLAREIEKFKNHFELMVEDFIMSLITGETIRKIRVVLADYNDVKKYSVSGTSCNLDKATIR